VGSDTHRKKPGGPGTGEPHIVLGVRIGDIDGESTGLIARMGDGDSIGLAISGARSVGARFAGVVKAPTGAMVTLS
jgi:hypothetical protein